jgi:hypothetical protein
MVRAQLVAGSVLAVACTRPPPPVTVIKAQPEYLSTRAKDVVGELSKVSDGVYCTDDDAFALPVIPFPNGPTEIRDRYKGYGITTSVEMYDANESVVLITRTKIRPDLPRDEVLGKVENSLAWVDQTIPDQTTQWVSQKGVTHLQHLNPSPGYSGKDAAFGLDLGQMHHTGYGPSDSCRVDRHFVGGAYYFQLTVAVHRIEPNSDVCKVALEVAAWTFENLQVGKGCGKAIPWVKPQPSADAEG